MKPFRFLAGATEPVPAREFAERIRRAEAFGFDTIVFPDHVVPQLAPVPAMAMVAALSDRLRIAPFVINNDLRHPAVLGHDLATVDLLSDGRLDWPSAPAGTSRSTTPSASPTTRQRRASAAWPRRSPC